MRAGLWAGLAVAASAARAESTNSATGAAATNAAAAQSDEIVITATRFSRPQSVVPTRVTTLGGLQIRTSPTFNGNDLLRSIDGVSVLNSYGIGYGIPGQINIRGVPGLYGTLVLADGLPLNEAATSFPNVNEVPDHLLERVEVVRGPFSSIYGADAFAGVIQFMTPDLDGTPRMEAAARAGNEGFRQGWGTVLQRAGNVSALIGVDARSIDNYVGRDDVNDRRWDPVSQQYAVTPRPADNYDYADKRLLGKVGIDITDATRLQVLGRYYEGDLGYGQTDLRPLAPVAIDNNTENASALLGATLSSELTERAATQATLAYRRQKRTMEGPDQAVDALGRPALVRSTSESVAHEWRAGGSGSLTLTPVHTVSAGADLVAVDCSFAPKWNADTGQILPGSRDEEADTQNAGVYVQDEAACGERVRIVSSLRADLHSEFGVALSPKAGLLYRPVEATTLRFSAGRAFRAPSVLELFQPDVSFGNLVYQSNPDLDPEYIVSADAGLEQQFSKALRGHIDVFYNDMRDLISQRTSGRFVTFENVDKAWSAGTEAGLEYALERWLPGVTAYVNGTHQQSEDRQTGLDLAYIPENLLNAGMRFEKSVRPITWSGSLSANYAGSRGYLDGASGQWLELKDHWRSDAMLKASHRSGIWTALSVQNLTDATYQESSTLDPAPGRLWYAEAGVRF